MCGVVGWPGLRMAFARKWRAIMRDVMSAMGKRKMGYKEKCEAVKKRDARVCTHIHENGILHGPQPSIRAIDDNWNLGRSI